MSSLRLHQLASDSATAFCTVSFLPSAGMAVIAFEICNVLWCFCSMFFFGDCFCDFINKYKHIAARLLSQVLTHNATLFTHIIGCSYKKLPVDMKPGMQILCADGSIVMETISADPKAGTVRARCMNNASLG